MTSRSQYRTVLFFLLIGFCHLAARAAEIRLLPQHECGGSIVLLSDIARILDDDRETAAALGRVELFLSPPDGSPRVVTLRELKELLRLRGVDLSRHELSGAPQVVVRSGSPDEGSEDATRASGSVMGARFRRVMIEQADKRVERAIMDYLGRKMDGAWQVKVKLDRAAAARIPARVDELDVAGGQEPWVGTQQFTLSFDSLQQRTRITVEAEVSLPEEVVVATRTMRRGEQITAADVRLQPAPLRRAGSHLLTRLEDAIGMETARALASGQPIDQTYLRKPILVRRRDQVTVTARAAGVQVRTQALALGEGGLNDIVKVSSLETGQQYYARVVGWQKLEVYARGTSVAATVEDDPSSEPVDDRPRSARSGNIPAR